MNIVGLCDKHRRKGAVHHWADKVKGITNRQDEGDDVARAAELGQLFQRLRIGGLGTAGGKCNQHRILQHAEQAEHLFLQHHITDGHQHAAGQQNGQVIAADEWSIVQQDPQPFGSDDRGDGGKNGQRRNVHHVAGDFQHDMRDHIQRGHQRRVEFLSQWSPADAEEHREDHNLQNFVIRHRADDAGRDGMWKETFQAHTADGEAGINGIFGNGQIQTAARVLQGDDKQAHQNRQHRRADKPHHRFTADAANRRGFTQLHDPDR